MHVDVITDSQTWSKLRANWETVFDADPEAQFFLSWDWISQRLATGWGQMFVLAVKERPQDTEYVAFFPLKMRTRQGDDSRFWQEIVVAGSPASDYTGFLCLPQFDARAIPALAKALLGRNWGVLWLHCFSASRKRANLFITSFPKGDFNVTGYEQVKEADGVNNWVCPYIDLPDDWDSYLESISANTRQKARRFLRKVDGSDTYRITHADADTIERDAEILSHFWGLRWIEEEEEVTADHVSGLKKILLGVHETGNLLLPVLWQGDRPLCALSFFIDRKTNSLLFYATGRDRTFKDLPVGLVLHADSIRFAIANGYKAYEFLRGDEPYKFSFAPEQRRIGNIVIGTRIRGNWGGRLDPMAIPTVFQLVQNAVRARDWPTVATGCKQILEVDTRHTGARALLAKLMQARAARK